MVYGIIVILYYAIRPISQTTLKLLNRLYLLTLIISNLGQVTISTTEIRESVSNMTNSKCYDSYLTLETLVFFVIKQTETLDNWLHM